VIRYDVDEGDECDFFEDGVERPRDRGRREGSIYEDVA